MAKTSFNLRRVTVTLGGSLAGLAAALWFAAFVLVDQDFTEERTIRNYAAILVAGVVVGSSAGAIVGHKRTEAES